MRFFIYGRKALMGEYTKMTSTYDNDTVLFDKYNGLFGLGANRYQLTEHGFLKITHGRIYQQSQVFDLIGATYEKSHYNFVLGKNTGIIQLNTGDQITIKRLFYRGFRKDLDKSIKNAQLEHRPILQNPKPYTYKTSKAWLIVALIIILALLTVIFVHKLIKSVHVDANDTQKTVSEIAERIGNLIIQDIRNAIGTNNLLS